MKLESKIDKYYRKINDIGVSINKKHKKTVLEKDNINKIITVKDENNKNLLKFSYVYIGSYDIDKELWMWSYNNFSLDDSLKNFKNSLFSLANEIKSNVNNYDDASYVEKVYNYLMNEIYCIKHNNILDVMKLSIYSLQGNGVISEFSGSSGVNKLDFYVVMNIVLNNV